MWRDLASEKKILGNKLPNLVSSLPITLFPFTWPFPLYICLYKSMIRTEPWCFRVSDLIIFSLFCGNYDFLFHVIRWLQWSISFETSNPYSNLITGAGTCRTICSQLHGDLHDCDWIELFGQSCTELHLLLQDTNSCSCFDYLPETCNLFLSFIFFFANKSFSFLLST